MNAQFITGFVVAAAIIAILWFSRKAAAKAKHYDEMQLQIRANGYKLGYMVTLIGLTVMIFFTKDGLNRWIEPELGMFIVMMAGVAVFAVYCILHEAFFSIGDRGNAYILLCLSIVVLNVILAVSRIMDGTLWESGIITFEHGASIVSSLTFLSVLIAFLIKNAQLKKEVNE